MTRWLSIFAVVAVTAASAPTYASRLAPPRLEKRIKGDFFGTEARVNVTCTSSPENASGDHAYPCDSGKGPPDTNGYEDSVNLYAGMRWDPINLRDPTGMAVQFVGHIYIIEGVLEGRAVVYVGSASDIVDRLVFQDHKWKELIHAKGTRVRTKKVFADLDVRGSGQGTFRSARTEALNSAERQVLDRVGQGKISLRRKNPRVLNSPKSPPTSDANRDIFKERHKVSFGKGRWSTAKRPGEEFNNKRAFGGPVLRSVGVGLAGWEMLMHTRGERAGRFQMSPFIFEDEQGPYFLSVHRGLTTTYYQNRILESGVLRSEIDEAEADELRRVGEALWGRLDWKGDFEPGLLRQELPVTERIDYPECYERFGVDEPCF